MNVITINASDLNGGIGSEIERVVRADYSNKVANRVLDHADVSGAAGLMFMAGFEACRALLLTDITSTNVAAEGTMLFYDAAWKYHLGMHGGADVKASLDAVLEDVIKAAEAKLDENECDCPKCRARREAEGQ